MTRTSRLPGTVPLTSERAVEHAFRRAVNWWRPILGMERWNISLEHDSDSAASCEADPKYRVAELTVNPPKLFKQDMSALGVEATALHELVHAMLWSLTDELVNPAIPTKTVNYFEEVVVEQVTEALLRAKYGNVAVIANLWRTEPL